MRAMRKARFSMLARNRSSARACSRIGSSTDVRAPSSHRKVARGPKNAGRLAEAGIDGPREERYSIQQRAKERSVDEQIMTKARISPPAAHLARFTPIHAQACPQILCIERSTA